MSEKRYSFRNCVINGRVGDTNISRGESCWSNEDFLELKRIVAESSDTKSKQALADVRKELDKENVNTEKVKGKLRQIGSRLGQDALVKSLIEILFGN